jgi:hypothetical protein
MLHGMMHGTSGDTGYCRTTAVTATGANLAKLVKGSCLHHNDSEAASNLQQQSIWYPMGPGLCCNSRSTNFDMLSTAAN